MLLFRIRKATTSWPFKTYLTNAFSKNKQKKKGNFLQRINLFFIPPLRFSLFSPSFTVPPLNKIHDRCYFIPMDSEHRGWNSSAHLDLWLKITMKRARKFGSRGRNGINHGPKTSAEYAWNIRLIKPASHPPPPFFTGATTTKIPWLYKYMEMLVADCR